MNESMKVVNGRAERDTRWRIIAKVDGKHKVNVTLVLQQIYSLIYQR